MRARRRNLLDLKKGIIEEEMYQRLIKNIRTERDRFTKLLESGQINIDNVVCETAQTILQLATNAESLWKNRSKQEQAMFIEKLLSNQLLAGAESFKPG